MQVYLKFSVPFLIVNIHKDGMLVSYVLDKYSIIDF